MRDFKFFSDNEEDDGLMFDDITTYQPSWMWTCDWPESTGLPHDVMTTTHHGIHDFLDMFPELTIIPVNTIKGMVNGQERTHNGIEVYEDGWGFDITNDLIEVEWIRYNDV